MRKIIICIGFVFILCSCDKAAKVSEDITNENEITDDNLRISIYRDINWNPHFEENRVNREAMGFIYEPLFESDGDINPVSVLAESILKEGTHTVIKLKNGITFHDRSKLTSEDVVYSVNLVISGKSQYENRGIREVNALDISTVEIIFEDNISAPEKSLYFPIVKNNFPEESDRPQGTGIYKFKEKIGYDTYSFEINNEYYDSINTDFCGLEMIQAENTAQMESLFDIGETDIIHIENLSFFKLRLNAGIYYYTSDEMICIGFNENNVDKHIIKAIDYSIDKKNVTEKCFINTAEYCYSEHDKYKAEEELQKSDNIPCELNIITENKDEYIRLSEEICRDISVLGIDCKITPVDSMIEDINPGIYDACISTYKLQDTELPGVIPICIKKGAISVCGKIKTEPSPVLDFVWAGYRNWKIK